MCVCVFVSDKEGAKESGGGDSKYALTLNVWLVSSSCVKNTEGCFTYHKISCV